MSKIAWKIFTCFFIILSVVVFGSICLLIFSLAQMESTSDDIEIVSNFEENASIEDNRDIIMVNDVDEEYVQEIEEIPLIPYDGHFELPINGATGFAPVFMSVRGYPDINSHFLIDLHPGAGFVILEEQDEWWQIDFDGLIGWVLHAYCFINLPDVMPSIIYNITNASSSAFYSSGVPLPGVTGHELYQGFSYNSRLGRDEFISPILYSTAIRIAEVQRMALEEGNTLVMVESFRPLSTQMQIVEVLSILSGDNVAVYQGLNQYPWHLGWFIATGVSSHQMGAAVDVTLARVDTQEMGEVGGYMITEIIAYTEYIMPTPIHELSARSVVFQYPISSDSYEWLNVALAATMNEPAITLQRYMTQAGFTPLASEWWHFDDNHGMNRIRYNSSQGDFFLSQIFSRVPE
jgi:D-alanyl-D-alanine dipeptidase